ncbi:MAG TPA: NAD(P)/FAD-dependent oxidoreductase [Solirubrobacteraceae bacterium]|nr:NAD(P)/FAD-dependent oxidoreductase [Solirubrobacteraceae bacterium]
MTSFDVIVIGAGPAGEVIAGRLGKAKLDVALVERDLVGGECSFYACMPSKALLRPGQALAEARRVPGAAEAVTGTVDVGATLKRRDEVIHELDDSAQLPWLDNRGVTLVRGHARLDGDRRVRVGDELLEARRAVVIATGSAAMLPPIAGLAEAAPWTNREATTATAVPARLLVLGGGPVGCELSQAYRTLGAEVTLVERGARLLEREEPFAGETVRDVLAGQGVDVRVGAEVVSAARDDAGVTLVLADGEQLHGDELLVASGRRQHTGDLGLETIGIEGGGPIEVGDDLRVTGHDWLYVLGDANGRALLTHMGKYQARIAADAILGVAHELRSDGTVSPRITFTEPHVAAVGYTLAGALDAGIDAFFVEGDMSATAGGSFVGRGVEGRVRLIVERGSDRVLGATIVAVDGGESLHAATIAVTTGLTMPQLWHAVPAFPSRSEFWLHLIEAWEDEVA